MSDQSHGQKPLNYYNIIPKNRDFYLLDKEENIKDFQKTNMNDPEYIFVFTENGKKKFHESIYKRRDFMIAYEFFKVETKISDVYLNFIAPKNNFNIGREIRLLTEIKKRPSFIQEIYRRTTINFNTDNDIIFKEIFNIPTEQRFYNRIFMLHISDRSLIKPPNIKKQNKTMINKVNNNLPNNNYNNNNNINSNGNNNNNFNFNSNTNNINYGQNNNYFDCNPIDSGYIGNFKAYSQGNQKNPNNSDINQQQNYPNNDYNPNYINCNNFPPNNFTDNNIQNYSNNNNSNNNFNQNNQNCNNQGNFYQNNQHDNFYNNNNYLGPNSNIGNYPPEINNLTEGNNSLPQNCNNQIQTGNIPLQNGNNSLSNGNGHFQINNNHSQDGNNSNQINSDPSKNGNNNNNNNNNGNDSGNNDNKSGDDQNPPIPPKFVFPKKGLKNIGSTCYMNATLQCLLHVSDLIVYFIDEYPKDQITLFNINKNVSSGGDISSSFYNLVIGVCQTENISTSRKKMNPKSSIGGFFGCWGESNKQRNNAFSPDEFKRALGLHNSQFRNFEANDSKDLILYLLQTMHEELNYFGDKNQRSKYIPNQYNLFETYTHFSTIYNSNNFSKISLLFYGTYKNSTICDKCQKVLYNFQKFEFISFAMYYYHKKRFNLYDGFNDNAKSSKLTGDNKFFCNVCNKLQEAETICKIFEPPSKLLINIDYGKNKKYQPTSVDFDDIIDITKFVDFDYKIKIKYRILGVCTHYGYSGKYGHYVAFCRNSKENKWYEFNDSNVSECSKNNAIRGSPYLLLYERIFE